MVSEILINATHEEIRVALLEGGQVVEFYIERKRDASLVGNIYKGKVVKILPGMQSAFIDIGLERAAFLYVADIRADIEEYAPFLEEEEKRRFRRIYLAQRQIGSCHRRPPSVRAGNPRPCLKRPYRQQRRARDIIHHASGPLSGAYAEC